MNPNDFGDPLTFLLVSLAGQNSIMPNALIYDQISANVMTLPNCSLTKPLAWVVYY